MDSPFALKISLLAIGISILDVTAFFDGAPNTTRLPGLLITTFLAVCTMKTTEELAHLAQTLRTPPRRMPPDLVTDLFFNVVGPTDARCSICLQDELNIPVGISRGHVFCRECALLTFAQRLSCPICLRTPTPLRAAEVPTQQTPNIKDDMALIFVESVRVAQALVFACVIWTSISPVGTTGYGIICGLGAFRTYLAFDTQAVARMWHARRLPWSVRMCLFVCAWATLSDNLIRYMGRQCVCRV